MEASCDKEQRMGSKRTGFLYCYENGEEVDLKRQKRPSHSVEGNRDVPVEEQVQKDEE